MASTQTFDSHTSNPDLANDQLRRDRTLFVKGIPSGLADDVIYQILFREPASLYPWVTANRFLFNFNSYCDNHQRNNENNCSSISSVGCVSGRVRPGVRPSRYALRRIRIHRSTNRNTRYDTAHIEFSCVAAADRARHSMEGRVVDAGGGRRLQANRAWQPILKGHWMDYDECTGRPCLFGLTERETVLVNCAFGFSQAVFRAAAAAQTTAPANHN